MLKRIWSSHGRAVLAALLLALGAWIFVGPLASLSRAAACDETWNGSSSTDWNTAANWTPASVPTSTQNVCIPAGSFTVSLSGSGDADSLTIGTGDTLAITATQTGGAVLALNASSTNSGTLELTDSATTTSSQEARVLIESGATLTNDGTILSDPGGDAQGTRVIDGQSATSVLDNASSGTITVNQDLQLDSGQNGLFETSGDITIASGKKLLVDPSGAGIGGSPAKSSAEMDIDGGTITDNGTFAQGESETGIAGGAALKVNGGTITGSGLTVVSGTGTDIAGTGIGASFSGVGTGKYTFIGSLSASATTLGGTIGANQTVVLSASTADGGVPVEVNSNVTNNGTLELTDSDTSGTNQNEARVLIETGDTLTNDGTILSSSGAPGAGVRDIDGASATSTLDNAGHVDVNASLEAFTTGGTFTTTGTIDVASGGTLEALPNGSGGGTTTFNLNGGTVTNSGTFELGINTSGGADVGAAFNINGGTVTGNPVIAALATTNFSGSGSGSFMLEGATSIFGGGTISGTIGSSDSVTLSGSSAGAGSAAIQTSGNVVNDGTFTMTDPDTTASTSAFAELDIPSGSTFTNDGTMTIAPGPDASGYRSIDGTLNNAGTLNVNMLLQLALHSVSGIDNSGTVSIASGQGIFILGGSDTYTQSAGTTSLGGSGATLSVAGVILQGGSLTGSGTLCGPGGSQSAPCGTGASSTDLTSAGTISPSPSPATITVNGDYTQSSSGTLTAEVTGAGKNDRLAVTGTATLAGTLEVSTAAGFTPSSGQQFQVLTSSGESGQFATTTGLQSGPYTVTFNADNVTLTATTPAPAASFNPRSITFGSASNTIAVGSTVSQALQITNGGSAPLVIGTLSRSGPEATSFSLTSDGCSGQTIQPGNSCSVTVNFHPATSGSYAADIDVPDNASGSPQQVALSGTAGAASTTGTLAGVVSDGAVSGNPPLADASVSACPWGGGGSCQSTTTGSNGAYSISGLTPGEWKIQVEPSQAFLFAAGSVLQIVAGLNTQDYALTPPSGLANGVSVNGQTSGVAYSFWTSPATVQAPITVPASGPAGTVGVTVVQFWAQPLSGTGGAPYAVGAVAIYYRFNAGGAPVFIGMDEQPFAIPSGHGPSIGTWSTSVTTKTNPFVPVAGETVGNYMAQGDFVPPPAGPDYHGAFFYQIHQWSLFVGGSANSARDFYGGAHTAQAAPGTLGEAESCLRATGAIPNYCDPNPNPPSNCPSNNSPPLNFTNQQGSNGGLWDPGNGAMWDSGTSTLTLPGGIMISNYGGSVTQWTNPESPGSTLQGPYTYSSIGVTVNGDGSITYDGYTFYPNGSIQTPGGATYNKHGQQTGGPPQGDNCKPHYNYWDPVTGWQDPSGTVLTTKRVPVPAATVVLTRSDKHGGPFRRVPNGSLFMSPGNRRNPDHTTALGVFGWDVVPGYYRVSARHAGCTAVGGGASVFSPVLTIPPAVTNVNLRLRCPHLRRRPTHTKLTARKVPVNEVTLVAVVRGGRLQGTVTFERGGRKLGVVTLSPRTERAVFTVAGNSTKGFRAVYQGDGYNAPSTGSG